MTPKKAVSSRSTKKKTSTPAGKPVRTAAPSSASKASVTLHVLGGPSYTITPHEEFQRSAMYWEYVLRNRIRWAQDENTSQAVTQRALDTLAKIGIGDTALTEIAKAGVVEIEIPYTSAHEEIGWELRIFPWEFLLFTGTAGKRTSAIIVIRHSCCTDRPAPANRTPKKLMVVESAPGKLADMYSFSSERKLVESNLSLNKLLCPRNPTIGKLKALVSDGQPDVVHLAGIDSHQGEQLLHTESRTTWDGYLMADANGNPSYATAEQLAEALRGSKGHAPLLVSCNFWNSASRVAALIAAESTTAAIGFQDEVGDQVAENFFAKFYFNYRAMDWDLLRAYRLAVRDMHFGGAIAVLWTSQSLLPALKEKPLQSDADQLRSKRQEYLRKEIPATTEPWEVLDVVVKPKDTVNYSLLHNEQSLFEEFSLRKLRDGLMRGISIELTLYMGGAQTFPYRSYFDMSDSYLSLADKIRFPLTSYLLRSLRESVKSVIYIDITWNNKIVFRDTLPVKLLAIDEWVDTPELDAYLPSFVLSRDNAVAKIIDSAQRYVRLFNEDSTAGFDGYQGVDRKAKDPYLTVDFQVKAIWSTLSFDMALGYINPPPTFTQSSQRLRTPSDVINGKRGTCIDLALLLSACLEYVGIDPVLFLLSDHAFPGYWRNEKARDEFLRMSAKSVMPFAASREASLADAHARTPNKPWMFTNYAEVEQLVKNGDVVPLETTYITQQLGFTEAMKGGKEDLRERSQFCSMIDVQRARTDKNSVAPLPIVEETR
jgi:hypothetical protein